jgi:hypothetical protein
MDSLKFRLGPPCLSRPRLAGRPPPETALQLFLGWPVCRAGSLLLSSTFSDPTPYAYGYRCTVD